MSKDCKGSLSSVYKQYRNKSDVFLVPASCGLISSIYTYKKFNCMVRKSGHFQITGRFDFMQSLLTENTTIVDRAGTVNNTG